MFPWQRDEFINHKELFPKMSMPRFKATCHLRNQTSWVIKYSCTCDRPNTLFCQSLCVEVVKHWEKLLQKYIEEQDKLDPSPTTPITNFCALQQWSHYSLYFDYYNPLTCMHFILTHRSVRENYSVGRHRGIYYLYIVPNYAHHRVLQCLRSLSLAKRRLPFKLQIDCFPYTRISHENDEDIEEDS
ncbi:hypothetical protein ORF14A [Aviadenovirus bubonis]|nr:hypothetical protein ORF14A [Owl adenovirus]